MTISQEYYLTCKLDSNYHQIARNFATQQDTIEKGKKVYLNTLAVCAVKDFIEELSFETILDRSYSWNPVIRCFEDVADLVVSELGRVECLSITEDTDSVYLPKEVREGRIAYIVVRFPEVLTEVELLGFRRCPDCIINAETIQVSELEPVEDLIDYLFDLELAFDSEGEVLSDDESNIEYSSSSALAAKTLPQWSVFERFQQSFSQTVVHVQTEIDTVAEQVSWLLSDFQLRMEGTKAIRPKDIDESQPRTRKIDDEIFKKKYLKLPLTIAGQNYELRIIPKNISINEWRFELRNAAFAGKIPPGFKLRLLDKNGEAFEDNEAEATNVVDTLHMEFEFELGEGIIWEIEPTPDHYQREIIYF